MRIIPPTWAIRKKSQRSCSLPLPLPNRKVVIVMSSQPINRRRTLSADMHAMTAMKSMLSSIQYLQPESDMDLTTWTTSTRNTIAETDIMIAVTWSNLMAYCPIAEVTGKMHPISPYIHHIG